MRIPTRVERAGVAVVSVAAVLALGGADPAVAVSPGLRVPKGATVVVHGRGNGHGHGLSQYGAQGAAEQGLSTRQILAFYYPHTDRGHLGGSVRVLLTETIGKPTTVVARPGLEVHDLASGRTIPVPAKGRAAAATRWRMSGAGQGDTRVSYRTGGWHTWRTLTGNGEFRSTRAPLTLALGRTRVTYRGTLRSVAAISKDTHRITVNKVSLEGYVKGVVPREMPSSWRPAALRAQAVAARTYASYEAAHHTDPRFDLCDSSSCQVYGGRTAEASSTDRAVEKTAGQVLTYAGAPAFTQFSASNGGQLARSDRPYLVGKPDPYDTVAVDPTYTSWRVRVTAARIARTWPVLGRLTSIEVTSRDGHGKWGGRILRLVLHGTKGDKALSGDDFRGGLGLWSTYLDLTVPGSSATRRP
ncbi:MAG: SpoIID/LytB domain-containing protein [Nocardioides sp.]